VSGMSEFISLRAITEADLPTLYENQRDPEATEMVGFPARELDAFLAHRARNEANPTNESRAIMVGENLAGDIVSWAQDGERRIGYWISKQYWGRGVASAALKAFVAELTERPLYADVLKTNAGSIRVLEKAGFRLLGEDELGPDPDPEEHTFRLDR
jgi:RimJ/RimL family protein N-acetyltransferase